MSPRTCTFSVGLPGSLALSCRSLRTQIAQNDPANRRLGLGNLLRTGQLLSSPAFSRLKGGGKGLRLAPQRWGAPSLGLPRLLS